MCRWQRRHQQLLARLFLPSRATRSCFIALNYAVGIDFAFGPSLPWSVVLSQLALTSMPRQLARSAQETISLLRPTARPVLPVCRRFNTQLTLESGVRLWLPCWLILSFAVSAWILVR